MSVRHHSHTSHHDQKATAIPVADLALIMERIELIGKRIARELTAAGLSGELGYTGETNVQGEKVKKLDQWGNEVFLDAFEHGYPVCSLISEEMDEPRHYSVNCRDNSYCILYDPIDGSSNTDVNGSLGTIFAVKKRAKGHSKGIEDLLVPGTQQTGRGLYSIWPSSAAGLYRGRRRRYLHARSHSRRVHPVERKREDAAARHYLCGQPGQRGKVARRRAQIPRAYHQSQR